MPPSSANALDELLHHAGFLRELARELCADGARAEDLEQEVWLRTLRHPPSGADSPRGWLATLARRLASNARRGDRRRTRREVAAPPRDEVPTPDQVLAREQLRERVVRAVLARDESFRDVLLLRYYEGLEPRAIARRLRVPDATVRTRSKRALEKLALRLDGVHGGDRDRWLTARLPFATATKASAGTLAAWTISMKKTVLPLCALFFVAVAIRVFAGGEQPATPIASESRSPSLARGTFGDEATDVAMPGTANAKRSRSR